jgi:DNA-binding NarL/FixJ family response regulator
MSQTEAGDSRARVLVADDQRLVREGIASLLGLDEGILVVGTAANGREALDLARTLHPDVCLLDIRMPLMDGIEALQKIRAEGLCPCVLMLTTFDDGDYVLRSIQAGARGYLLKDLPGEELAKAVHQARHGVFLATGEAMERLLGSLPPASTTLSAGTGSRRAGFDPDPSLMQASKPKALPAEPRDETDEDRSDALAHAQVGSLTPRERSVLALVGQGLTNAEIAGSLGLSEGTVKNYLSGILTALGFRDRIQAALFAARTGLEPEE